MFANITEKCDTLQKPKGELLNGYLALVEAVLGTVTPTQLRHTYEVLLTYKDENLVLSNELIKVELPP